MYPLFRSAAVGVETVREVGANRKVYKKRYQVQANYSSLISSVAPPRGEGGAVSVPAPRVSLLTMSAKALISDCIAVVLVKLLFLVAYQEGGCLSVELGENVTFDCVGWCF